MAQILELDGINGTRCRVFVLTSYILSLLSLLAAVTFGLVAERSATRVWLCDGIRRSGINAEQSLLGLVMAYMSLHVPFQAVRTSIPYAFEPPTQSSVSQPHTRERPQTPKKIASIPTTKFWGP